MGNKTVNEVMQKMIAYSEGNLHDIAHFMKVYAFARTIGVAENLTPTEQETVEIAAILHDIACPLCREKYGNTDTHQRENNTEPTNPRNRFSVKFLHPVQIPIRRNMSVHARIAYHHQSGEK